MDAKSIEPAAAKTAKRRPTTPKPCPDFGQRPEDAFVTPRELAALLGVAVATAHRILSRDPDAPRRVKVNNRVTRLRVREVRLYLNRLEARK